MPTRTYMGTTGAKATLWTGCGEGQVSSCFHLGSARGCANPSERTGETGSQCPFLSSSIALLGAGPQAISIDKQPQQPRLCLDSKCGKSLCDSRERPFPGQDAWPLGFAQLSVSESDRSQDFLGSH